MTGRLALTFAVAILVTGPTAALAQDQPAAVFPDKNLEAAVRSVLKKGEKDALAEADLKNVYIR